MSGDVHVRFCVGLGGKFPGPTRLAGSVRSGRRAAAVMSLIQSAKLNGLDPHAYLKDVLNRLPTQKASAINELLPHNWVPEPADGG